MKLLKNSLIVTFNALLLVIFLYGCGNQGPTALPHAGGKPDEVHCAEPLPVFTLGEYSNATKAQEAALCACIWQSLGAWERRVSEKIATDNVSEVSPIYIRGFTSRFGSAVEKCGGMEL
jgi:hypothetical protein